jgi:endonuclease/exonuclease/phosphatase family metal-dependent hydrolase
MNLLRIVLLAGTLTGLAAITGCKKEPLTEFPAAANGTSVESVEFRIVSYNIHGGKGPNGEGSFTDNLSAFRAMLQGEAIICLQEVEPDCWNQLKALFPEYEYRYFLPQTSTKFGTNKQGGNAIFSQFPIEAYDQHLVQTDPGGDKWERKTQYVRIYIGKEHQYLNLFHYHNTYNWHENNSAAEKAGLERYSNYVESKSINPSEMIVLIGDFNLNLTQSNAIISTSDFPNSESNWVDHIYTNAELLLGGIYNTYENALSDHQAVWAVVCNEDC